jgi:hypothetical protein
MSTQPTTKDYREEFPFSYCAVNFQHNFDSRNYAEYASAWRTEYKKANVGIEKAIANLKNGRAFMPKTSLTDTNLTKLAKQSWFKERVFDIFLWEVGGDG